jgi:glutathione reductase (NADPH)
MQHFDFDLFVIGGGSGGVRCARMSAQRGARVAVAEVAAMGGTCVNVGCIPKKLYSYAAHFAESFEESHGFGWVGEAPRFDWDMLKANRAREITRLNGIYVGLLENAGVKIIRGWARLIDGHTVEVDGEKFTAKTILVATGGTPTVPAVPGREHVVTSDNMFDLDPFPKRLLVVGGGYIACEFASIFNGLGSQVTHVHRNEKVLRGFDDDVRKFVAAEMAKTGINQQFMAEVSAVAKTPEGLQVDLKHKHRPHSECQRRRAGGSGRFGQRIGRDPCQRALPKLGAIHLRAGRRDGAASAHAGGTRRGDGGG